MRFLDHFSALQTDERVLAFASTQRQMDCLVACDDLGSADPTFYIDRLSQFPVTEGNKDDHSIWEFASLVKFKKSKDGNRGAAGMRRWMRVLALAPGSGEVRPRGLADLVYCVEAERGRGRRSP